MNYTTVKIFIKQISIMHNHLAGSIVKQSQDDTLPAAATAAAILQWEMLKNVPACTIYKNYGHTL